MKNANGKRKFIFRCEDCKTIIPAEFEDEKDLEDLAEDILYLECACGGRCLCLRD